MIPPLHQALLIVDQGGAVLSEFHRWLQLVQRALHGPFVGQQASGTAVVGDGEYGLHGKRLLLAGRERATIIGSGRLVICG